MRHLSRILTIVTLAVTAWTWQGVGHAQATRTAEAQLKAAQNKEEVEGDLQGAINLYKQLAAGKDRTVAARALLRLAACYQKLGNSQSRQVYEQLVRDFQDQKEAVAEAQKHLAAVAPAALMPRVICRDCDYDDATITADGRYMGVNYWEADDIGIRDMATGRVTPLRASDTSKADPILAYFPVASPDGQWVAFQRWVGPKDRRQGLLSVMPNKAGAAARTLVEGPDLAEAVATAWSPDGKSILTAIQWKDQTWQLAWVSLTNGATTVVASLGWTLDAYRASLAPDGKFIAYSALAIAPKAAPARGTPLKGDRHIYVIAADGSGLSDVVTMPGVNGDPVWTPDGGHLLFENRQDGSIGLWELAMRGGRAVGAPLLVQANTDGMGVIGITTAGTFYYVKAHVRDPATVVIAQKGETEGPIELSDGIAGVNPSWSPDGKSLAFTRPRPGNRNAFDLVIHSSETGHELIVSHDGLEGFPPIWFHDNSAFLTKIPGRQASEATWYAVNARSGAFTEVIPASAGVTSWDAALSPDDSTLYYCANTPGKQTGAAVFAMDLATKQKRQIFAPSVSTELVSTWLGLSPDGRTLATVIVDRSAKTTQLGRVGVDGTGYRTLHTVSAPAGLGRPEWSPDGKTIFFAGCAEDCEVPGSVVRTSIFSVPADGGTPSATGISRGSYWPFSVNLDGIRIAYTSQPPETSIVYAIDNLPAFLKALK
jgi:Tol biopolymer transport system component